MFPPRKKKRPTRRSISITGLSHQRLKTWCDDNDMSMSGFFELVIAEKMDAAGVPVPEVLRVHYPVRRTNETVEDERAACFSM